MRFSERHGYKPVRKIIQIDSMNDELKNALWNVLTLFIWERVNSTRGFPSSTMKDFCDLVWFDFFKETLDTMPNTGSGVSKLLRYKFFSEFQWF
jgi:AbiJ N-terminal domain 4